MDPEQICEEMTCCLASDCEMSALGCDNKTVVLVCFPQGETYEELANKCSRVYTSDNVFLSESSASDADDDATALGDYCLNESLEDIVSLNTVRLEPERYTVENGIVTILEDGQLCIKFLKENNVTKVCSISSDGLKVTIYKPKKKILPSDKLFVFDIEFFSVENLPESHWDMYRVAKKCVDVIKAQTPKVTIYGQHAKCVMMENADYDIDFYDGFRITEIGGNITVIDQGGNRLSDENKWDPCTKCLLDVFENMKKECCETEAVFSRNADPAYLPIIVGRRPAILGNIDDSREKNTSPRSNQLSTHDDEDANTDTDESLTTEEELDAIYEEFSERLANEMRQEHEDFYAEYKEQQLLRNQIVCQELARIFKLISEENDDKDPN